MKKVLKKYLPQSVKSSLILSLGTIKSIGKQKFFGIGLNKTGTTSLKTAMKEFGYVVGHQRTAEEYVEDWAKRDFKRIVNYCKTAEFFQDVPFSKPFTYVVLDHAYPGSKFILTVRDSPEQWYESLTKFHASLWGKNGRIPTKEDLQHATYRFKGSPWIGNRLSYNTPEDDPYNKEILIDLYNTYNRQVTEYFRHRPDDLLILNVAEDGAYKNLCEFLNRKPVRDEFPWKNRTVEAGRV
ncbi:MAG: hypothetical protein JJU37_08865 [Balneolaceae bacterium]|nr:hypothetical protein [Balneolaceae bacterium]